MANASELKVQGKGLKPAFISIFAHHNLPWYINMCLSNLISPLRIKHTCHRSTVLASCNH